jgi:hypothetical protein
MAVYASQTDLAAWVEDNPYVMLPGEDEAVERLLQAAERAVDRAIGGTTRDGPNGLRVDPDALDEDAREALRRATCAAAEHLEMLGPEFWVAEDDFLPNEVTILRRAQRESPRMLEELAGHGLVRRSGCVATPETTTTTILSAQEPPPAAARSEA